MFSNRFFSLMLAQMWRASARGRVLLTTGTVSPTSDCTHWWANVCLPVAVIATSDGKKWHRAEVFGVAARPTAILEYNRRDAERC
jgi:hypothetical protein